MSRVIFKISGPDREHFLQGLVTNDVTKLSGGLVYTAMLTPQGKYLADFFLAPADTSILLDVDVSISAALAQRLTMYKLRADVTIEKTNLNLHRGFGNPPDDGFPDPRTPSLGWRAYRDEAQQDDMTDWTALRITHNVPAAGHELSGESYILEMGFERLNGVDFRKGCYVGQEVTARMKHKTELRKGLARVIGKKPLTEGAAITSAGKTVGQIHSVSGTQALAYLRFDRATGLLETNGIPLEIERSH